MKRMIAALVFVMVLCGCQEQKLESIDVATYTDGTKVFVMYDNKRHVTCWATTLGGISCIPNNNLKKY